MEGRGSMLTGAHEGILDGGGSGEMSTSACIMPLLAIHYASMGGVGMLIGDVCA